MRHLLFIALLLGNIITSYAQEPTAQATELLAKQLKATHSLSAEFKQIIRDHSGAILQESLGTLLVKQPKKLRWHITSPYEHLVISNGETIWLYDVDLEQANKERYRQDTDNAPALLLSGNIELIRKNFTVSQQVTERGQQGFSLHPKVNGGSFTQLDIFFKGDDIASLIMRDSFDQQTTIELLEPIRNAAIDDQQFDFSPPEGVEVIDNDR